MDIKDIDIIKNNINESNIKEIILNILNGEYEKSLENKDNFKLENSSVDSIRKLFELGINKNDYESLKELCVFYFENLIKHNNINNEKYKLELLNIKESINNIIKNKNSLKQKDVEIAKLKSLLKTVQQQNYDLIDEIKRLNNENSDLKKQNKKQKKEIQSLTQEKEELKKQKEELEEHAETLKKIIKINNDTSINNTDNSTLSAEYSVNITKTQEFIDAIKKQNKNQNSLEEVEEKSAENNFEEVNNVKTQKTDIQTVLPFLEEIDENEEEAEEDTKSKTKINEEALNISKDKKQNIKNKKQKKTKESIEL